MDGDAGTPSGTEPDARGGAVLARSVSDASRGSTAATRRFFAARRFAGIATDELAQREEEKLAKCLSRDGLVRDAAAPASLAQYNDPLTNPVQRRNDVLIKLETFDVGRLDK